MYADRYVKIVLTVIAVELLWLATQAGAPPVSAQTQPAATPVIIRGIDLSSTDAGFLPVAVVGSFKQVPVAARESIEPLAAEVTAARPLRIDSARPLKVEIDHVVKVENDEPLLVQSVQYTPTRKPQ